MLRKNTLPLRLVAVSVLVFGILFSIYSGQALKNDAEKAWFNQATWSAEKATNSCLSWFALLQTQLRGVAALFYGSDLVTGEEFYDVLDVIEVVGSFPFHSIGFATRDPMAYSDEYIVTLSSDTNSILSPGVDLTQNEQIFSAIQTAQSFPGEVILSHPFEDAEGNILFSLLLTAHNFDREGILIATVNLLELLGDLGTLHIPKGLHLSTIQMTGMFDATPKIFFKPESLPEALYRKFYIRVDSGKSHLAFFWDITSDFYGGVAVGAGWLVQVAGSLLSLMLSALLLFLVKENAWVKRKVEERTAELSAAVEKINDEIIEKKYAEKALKASETRLKALSDASFEAIILSDNGICVDLNNTAVNMFGYPREEALGSPYSLVFSPEQLKQVNEKIQLGGETPYEAIATRKDGSVLPLLVRGRTIDHFGRDIRVTAMTDITDRKQAEEEKEKLSEQLHTAKKMESIGLMAGGVAHDLNNILSGIICYPELMLKTLDEDSRLRKPIEAIHESGQRAATVVADLLTVARGAATTREICSLNSLALEYLDSPEYEKLKSFHPAITYKYELAAEHHTISCSPVHIKKCLMNLVTNAAEAMVDKGVVVVSTYNQDIAEVSADEHEKETGQYVVLSVQDDGPGIPHADLEHIFEPFYTRKEMGKSGTGLGLTVVWNTLEDHNGKVLVESSEKGTCFKLCFPVSNEKISVQTQEKIDFGDLTGNNEHILIVDDEDHLRDIATQMLLGFGYRVDSVSSGELAIDFVRNTPVDLLVLDMLMKPGINGYKTYKEILKQYPDQKAIVASGFSENEDVKATIRLGADCLLKKPYSTDQLGFAVKNAINGIS